MSTIKENLDWLKMNTLLFELSYNEHEAYYEDPVKYYANSDVLDGTDMTSGIWRLQVYPNTPVSFYVCAGNDIEEVLQHVVNAVKEER